MGNEPEVAMKHMAACASESAAERVTAFGIPAVSVVRFRVIARGRDCFFPNQCLDYGEGVDIENLFSERPREDLPNGL